MVNIVPSARPKMKQLSILVNVIPANTTKNENKNNNSFFINLHPSMLL